MSSRTRLFKPANNETLVRVSDSVDEETRMLRKLMTKHDATVTLPPRQIEMVAIHRLKPAPQNARTHSKKQITQVANSMKRFGVINPLVVDGQNRIIAGHARAEAGKRHILRTAQSPTSAWIGVILLSCLRLVRARLMN
jgi:hypothetical protein